MCVRRKKNKSKVISIQIIDKGSGNYKMIKTIGSSKNLVEIEDLVQKGKEWIKENQGVLEIDFNNERQIAKQFLDSIEQINISGTELLLGKLYDEIGFGKIKDEYFRILVISRLIFPVSKLKTVDYLQKYSGLSIDVQVIYRYLDKLYKTQKEEVQKISYEHTLKVLNNEISVVFYDVTTIYFQADN